MLHLVSDSQRFSYSQELTPTLTLGLSFGLASGLAWDHIKDKKFFIETSFKDFFIDLYDDIHLLYLVSYSQRLSFSLELTPTVTLRLIIGLGLGLVWDHIKDKKFFICTTFNNFSLNVYDDIHVLHLVSDSQRLSFSQDLTPTPTLGLSFRLGLGLTPGKTIRV